MLKKTVHGGMRFEGENVSKSSVSYDEFNALNKRINCRAYNKCEDVSKASLASNELSTLRTDLHNATKSLEKSLSMAESLKVHRFVFPNEIVFNSFNVLRSRNHFEMLLLINRYWPCDYWSPRSVTIS